MLCLYFLLRQVYKCYHKILEYVLNYVIFYYCLWDSIPQTIIRYTTSQYNREKIQISRNREQKEPVRLKHEQINQSQRACYCYKNCYPELISLQLLYWGWEVDWIQIQATRPFCERLNIQFGGQTHPPKASFPPFKPSTSLNPPPVLILGFPPSKSHCSTLKQFRDRNGWNTLAV